MQVVWSSGAMQPASDGNSYGEAAQKGQEALESIIEFYQWLVIAS
jgi:predicted RNase H-like HicB family nuclease